MKKLFLNLIIKIRNFTYIFFQENPFSLYSKRYSQVTHCIGGNIGDTVLSKCVRDTFENFHMISNWKIITVNDPIKKNTIKKINNSEALIIGGGGLFLPDTNSNSISGWIWAISRNQLTLIDVPIIIFSVGFNYFRGQDINSVFIESIKYLIEKSSFVGLRNHGSIDKIKDILPNNLKDKVKYQPCTTTLIRILDKSIPPKKETKTIAINMAFDRRKMRYGKNEKEILMQVATAMKNIENRGYKIIYVMHFEMDADFIPYLEKAQVSFSIVDLSNGMPRKAIQFYNGIDLVFGMRGHAQMIPFGLNCEIISLGTHDKLKWFLEDIDSLDWYIELNDDIDKLSEKIVNTFIKVHEDNAKLTKERLEIWQEKLWKITCDNMREIKRIIETGA